MQSEVWKVLEEDEYRKVWDQVYTDLDFYGRRGKDFAFKTPVDVYDISSSLVREDNEEINEKIRLALIECMKDDPYMYALDWQHTGFRYNPRVIDNFEYPVFIKYKVPIKNEHAGWEGYNVWFPKFYSDGEYYFFIAKDFSWGYFTHTWFNKVYILGDFFRKRFKEIANEIGYIPCEYIE